MFNQKVSLVAQTISVNDYGDPVAVDGTTTPVYCKIVSANEKEKTYAESRGENAELVIIIPDKKMYDGQLAVLVDSVRYKVVDVKFTDTSRQINLVVRRWNRQ